MRKLIVLGAVLGIVTSAVWIYRFQTASPVMNPELHQAVGHVMAEETARLVGHLGKIVIVTMDTRRAPELKVQVQAFEQQLKLIGGISVNATLTLDPGDNPKFRPGAGLSAKRFLKIARKNAGADAIVSFVGAPQMSDEELAQLKSAPKLVAETHSPQRLVNLFQKKILLSAIVPRYEFPAPGPRKPQTSRQWFDHYFQILAPDTPMPSQDDVP